MKVRHDPPVHPGDNGKQGDERFRAIQKYPTATDTAIKRSRDNDTSSTELAENPAGVRFPWTRFAIGRLMDFLFWHFGFEEKMKCSDESPQKVF
mgnify:CR=1 FL=1